MEQSVEKTDAESGKKAADDVPKPKGFFGIRHLVIFMMFLGLTVTYSLRVILSVTIVNMTDETIHDGYQHFNWANNKDTVLSSFFWGYVVTQIPGGQLSQMFGGYPLVAAAATVSGVFTLLLPVSATLGGWQLVCANRVLQGLGQGLLYPGIHTLLSRWSPVEERGRFTTYVYAGGQAGTILGLALSGVLATSGGGWPSVFYVFGSVGCAWVVLWLFMGANSPATHRWCSAEERAYIEHSLGDSSSKKAPSVPWKSIFTSIPMWSLIIVHCGQNWGFWTLLTEIPSYMQGVLQYDLKSNALLSALPYLVMWILSFFFSYASDFANTRKLLPLGVSRKIFNSIGHWGPMAALLGMGYVGSDQKSLAVGLLTIAVGLNAAVYVGFQINHIDLSPNFAGTMMGITNCAGNIMSIIGPLIVGVIVNNDIDFQDEEQVKELQLQWREVFFIASGFYLVGNLVFVIFGKAEVQPWNNPAELKAAESQEEEVKKEEVNQEKAEQEKW